MTPDRIVFVGLSTTGPIPGVHHAWEIGLVERRTDGSQHQHQLNVHPTLANASADYLADTRYHERTCTFDPQTDRLRFSDSPKPTGWADAHQAAVRIARITAGATLAGHDVALSAAFLDRFLRSTGSAPAWRRLIDVDVLADGFAAGRGYEARLEQRACDEALDAAVDAAELFDAVFSQSKTLASTLASTR